MARKVGDCWLERATDTLNTVVPFPSKNYPPRHVVVIQVTPTKQKNIGMVFAETGKHKGKYSAYCGLKGLGIYSSPTLAKRTVLKVHQMKEARKRVAKGKTKRRQ